MYEHGMEEVDYQVQCQAEAEAEGEAMEAMAAEAEQEAQLHNEEMTPEGFMKEMRIFWQNVDMEIRKEFGDMLEEYFDEGYRADRVIQAMQVKI